ncbi:MAG: fabH, partial [Rubritepida sp.]|nr:fabH [Rubritepida sp.]
MIVGCGGYLPPNILDNDALAAKFGLDTTDEWIRDRSGIRQRHLAGPDDSATSLGAEAARRALAQAGTTADEVDAVIVATSTPDNAFPSTGAHIQAALGMTRGFAFDISAACTGFIYGLSVADALIRSGQARSILVIGTEVYSRILDWTDRSTCVLFGDGAGAVLLRAEEGERGVLSTHLH